MARASVVLKEVDLSTRVASFEGVFGAILIPAKKGPSEPQLMTSDTQLLNTYTPNGKVEVGYDLSYYSGLAYLERANKLWVKRVTKDAEYSGVVFGAKDSGVSNAAFSGENLKDPTARVFQADEAFILVSSNGGEWGKDIAVKVTTIEDRPNLVEPDSFLISIFQRGNEAVPVEEFLVSRKLGQKDDRGLNIYIEDVLESSNYIRAINNELIDASVLPKSQSEILYLGDGSDGEAISDADMVLAVEDFSNANSIPMTIIMDGGYATPAYQKKLDDIVKSRQDSFAILSTPYASQVGTDYINDLVDYRKNQLNLNSSHSALYAPHIQIQDKFNDRKIWISPDGAVAGSISFTSQNFEIWYPPAGFKRGILNVLDTRLRLTDGEMDLLSDEGLNCIRFISGKGIVVWGQKTLLASASALSRVNVRMLLIVIEPAIKDFLENFLFELNDVGNRDLVETGLDSYLRGIQSRKGLYGYDVVCNDSNNTANDIDNNRMNVDVFLKPTISTETIPVRIVITPNNISFSAAADAV